MAIDLDELFSYSTIKLVVIRDRRLGIIHYILQLIVAAYIIGYTIVYEKRYLSVEPPYGTIRATARQPDDFPDAQFLPYCRQNQSSFQNFSNSECVYMLGTDITFPPGQVDSIFVATRIKDTTIKPNSENCTSLPSSLKCAPNITGAPSVRYYLAGVEDYTIYMEHSIFGKQNNIMLTNRDCNGEMKFKDKRKIKFTDKTQGGDILPVKTILEAAGVNSLDVFSNTLGNGTLRYDGTLIIAIVNYRNDAQDTDKFSYYYELFQIPGVDVLSMQPTVLQADQTLLQRNYYGVRMVFLVVGSIGYFDFLTLLQSLVAGAVLIKTASVVVDLLILHILPEKLMYREHKFEMTEDFGDVREARKL